MCTEYFNVLLPTRSSGNPIFISMGIEFGPFLEGDEWRSARLPNNWKIENKTKRMSVILDDKNSVRANIFDISGNVHMNPICRFRQERKITDRSVEFCIFDERKKGYVFTVNYTIPSAKIYRPAHEADIESFASKNECSNWLKENFPNWEDPNAYWD